MISTTNYLVTFSFGNGSHEYYLLQLLLAVQQTMTCLLFVALNCLIACNKTGFSFSHTPFLGSQQQDAKSQSNKKTVG